jgi:hypothetical protein
MVLVYLAIAFGLLEQPLLSRRACSGIRARPGGKCLPDTLLAAPDGA